MRISSIGDQRRKAKSLTQTTTEENRTEFLRGFLRFVAGFVYGIKGGLPNNRVAAEINTFCISLSAYLIDFIKLITSSLIFKKIRKKKQNPYLYKLTYGKESSDLITDSYRLRASHVVNAYFIGFPVISIAMFFYKNSRVRIRPTVFFHPLIMSLTLIELIRHVFFYNVWTYLRSEQKTLNELAKLDALDSILRVGNKDVGINFRKNTEDPKIKTAYQNQKFRFFCVALSDIFHPYIFFFLKVAVNLLFYEMRYESTGNLGAFWDSLGELLGSLNSFRVLYMSKSRGDLKKIGDSYNRNVALKTFLEDQRAKIVRIDYDPHAHAVICKNLKIANSPLHVAQKDSYNVEQIVQGQLKKDSILEVDEMYFSPGITVIYSKNHQVNTTFFKALNDQWIHMGGRTPKTQCQITMPCSKYTEVLYLPKSTFLPLYRTLLEAIIYPRTLKSFQNKKSLLSKVESLMCQLGLSSLSKTLMTKRLTWETITSLQLKRLLLIKAIVLNPKVLCLDGLIDDVGEYTQDMINLLKQNLPDTVILISSTNPHKNLKNTTTAYIHDKLLSFSKPCLDNTTRHATFLDKTLWTSKVDFSDRDSKATPLIVNGVS